jgi:hypothetical protein
MVGSGHPCEGLAYNATLEWLSLLREAHRA